MLVQTMPGAMSIGLVQRSWLGHLACCHVSAASLGEASALGEADGSLRAARNGGERELGRSAERQLVPALRGLPPIHA
jgi:hypothetical protein